MDQFVPSTNCEEREIPTESAMRPCSRGISVGGDGETDGEPVSEGGEECCSGGGDEGSDSASAMSAEYLDGNGFFVTETVAVPSSAHVAEIVGKQGTPSSDEFSQRH